MGARRARGLDERAGSRAAACATRHRLPPRPASSRLVCRRARGPRGRGAAAGNVESWAGQGTAQRQTTWSLGRARHGSRQTTWGLGRAPLCAARAMGSVGRAALLDGSARRGGHAGEAIRVFGHAPMAAQGHGSGRGRKARLGPRRAGAGQASRAAAARPASRQKKPAARVAARGSERQAVDASRAAGASPPPPPFLAVPLNAGPDGGGMRPWRSGRRPFHLEPGRRGGGQRPGQGVQHRISTRGEGIRRALLRGCRAPDAHARARRGGGGREPCGQMGAALAAGKRRGAAQSEGLAAATSVNERRAAGRTAGGRQPRAETGRPGRARAAAGGERRRHVAGPSTGAS